jgi:regulator of sigma E protease
MLSREFSFDFSKKFSKKLKNDSINIVVERNSKLVNLRAKVNPEGKLGFIPKTKDKFDFQIINLPRYLF